MLQPLPSLEQLQKVTDVKNGRILIGLAMHDVINEIYDYEVLPISVYAPYTSEQCIRRANQLPLIPFSKAHPLLKKCGLFKESKKQVDCAFDVVNK